MYVHEPAVVQLTEPCAPLVFPVTVSVSPLGSVSFASTLTVPDVSSAVVRVSLTASGVKTGSPPTLSKANMNVLGVPSVAPSSVEGCPRE